MIAIHATSKQWDHKKGPLPKTGMQSEQIYHFVLGFHPKFPKVPFPLLFLPLQGLNLSQKQV